MTEVRLNATEELHYILTCFGIQHFTHDGHNIYWKTMDTYGDSFIWDVNFEDAWMSKDHNVCYKLINIKVRCKIEDYAKISSGNATEKIIVAGLKKEGLL